MVQSLELSIKVNSVFSENTYLAAGAKVKKSKNKKSGWITEKKVPYLYKRSDVRLYQSKIESQLWKNYAAYIRDNHEFFSNSKFKTYFTYHLNHSINKRDLTNMKKLLEDSMTNMIKKVLTKIKSPHKFDDSLIYETHDKKIDADPSLTSELVVIVIECLDQ